MKLNQIAPMYRLLNSGKLSKMEDKEKFSVIKIVRVLKPIVLSFDDSVKDAQEKLKPENLEEMQQRAEALSKNANPSNREIKAVESFFSDYDKKVNECLSEEYEKEHEVTFDKLPDSAFEKLVASNDWTVNDIITLQDALC